MTKACGIKIGKDKRQSERQITYNMFNAKVLKLVCYTIWCRELVERLRST